MRRCDATPRRQDRAAPVHARQTIACTAGRRHSKTSRRHDSISRRNSDAADSPSTSTARCTNSFVPVANRTFGDRRIGLAFRRGGKRRQAETRGRAAAPDSLRPGRGPRSPSRRWGHKQLPRLSTCFASARTVAALSSPSSGPPNSPTCCPVTTANAPSRSRRMFLSVCSDAPQARFCFSSASATRALNLGPVRHHRSLQRHLPGVRLVRIELADLRSVSEKIGEKSGGLRDGTERNAVGDHAIISRQHPLAAFLFSMRKVESTTRSARDPYSVSDYQPGKRFGCIRPDTDAETRGPVMRFVINF